MQLFENSSARTHNIARRPGLVRNCARGPGPITTILYWSRSRRPSVPKCEAAAYGSRPSPGRRLLAEQALLARGREALTAVIARSASDEAIHASFAVPFSGLLGCARNDVESPVGTAQARLCLPYDPSIKQARHRFFRCRAADRLGDQGRE